MSKKKKNPLDRNQGWALLFCAPNIIFFIIFFLWPAVIGLYYSFTNYDGWRNMDFIGLKNYIDLFHDSQFYSVFWNTVLYAIVSVPLGMIVSLFLALLLNDEKIKGNAITRVLVYWPTLLSTIMVGVTWKWIFGESFGVANYVLTSMGLPSVGWFSTPSAAFWTTIIATVWSGCGVNMLIYLGGIKQIPVDLYEAATIDGANAWQRFKSITLPSLKPVTFMILLTSTINAFKVFAMVQTLTNGGPGTATTYMIQYIYQTGFTRNRHGYASAASMILFVVLLIISFIQTRMNAKQEEA